jgi:putative glutamine amidotransferase
MTAAPIIGITSYLEPASWGQWRDVPTALIPQAYLAKVELAGGLAVLLPPRADTDRALAEQLLSRVDGLLLAGGVDVDPVRYGATRHPSVQESRADRDATELWLATVSAEMDLPTLGICRGMQVMAVAAGGILEQHLPDRVGHQGHSPAPTTYGRHAIRIDQGSRLGAVVGNELAVSSYHHQAVTAHPGYLPVGWDPDDGTLEAMEDPGATFRLAVQGHPEVDDDLRLFRAFVEAAHSTEGAR